MWQAQSSPCRCESNRELRNNLGVKERHDPCLNPMAGLSKRGASIAHARSHGTRAWHAGKSGENKSQLVRKKADFRAREQTAINSLRQIADITP